MTDDTHTCSQCGGEQAYVGTLGLREWFRCIRCGWEEHWLTSDEERVREVAEELAEAQA